ncbi:Serine/threonine protein kinase, partial [Globisporangium splendens]
MIGLKTYEQKISIIYLRGECSSFDKLRQRRTHRFTASQHLDDYERSYIVPGVWETIEAALATMTDLCTHMKEGRELCDQVTQRMRALRGSDSQLHANIDLLYQLLKVTHIAESALWRAKYDENERVHRERLELIVSQNRVIIAEIQGRALIEALTHMKYVIDGNDAQLSFEYSAEHMNLIRKSFYSVIRSSKSKVMKIPDWYIPRDQVQYDENPFDMGSYRTMHKGKWKGSDVIVKCQDMKTPVNERTFLREANLWWSLNHPHILKLLGACHLSTPMLFVSEFCENGNFVTYFQEPENRRYLWMRFLEAAHGICDFGHSFNRIESVPLRATEQFESMRWKALECHEGFGKNDLNLLFKSDMYSFGLCIIEAVSGEPPWGMMSDDEILDNLYDGNAHPRTPGFTDKEWEFVQAITRVDYEERESLDYAIKMLTELAEEEKPLSQEKLR